MRERPFEFSGLPGRFATPLFGGTAALLVGVAGFWGTEGRRMAPLVLMIVGVTLMIIAGRWLARPGVLSLPVLRERGVNLEAARPGDTPTVWLCAHLDSKSQLVPTLVRSAGIVIESVGLVATLALAVAAALGAPAHAFFWGFAGAVTLVGAIPVGLSMVGARSSGALDNASGVATVIAAARLLGTQAGVGILLTDAEELGLAGARAWASAQRVATVLNCDGVDDGGDVTVMFSGRRPARVLEAVAGASRAAGVNARTSVMFPGILLESVAFTDAGMPSVTVSRGSLGSFARVHSRRDDLTRLRGDGIAPTAALIAATARELA